MFAKGIIAKQVATATLGAALFVSSQANAAVYIYNVVLSGANEIPAVVTAGSGNAVITINNDNLLAPTMRVQVNFTGLTGNTSASHIHCCAVQPANVGVATELPSFTAFPLGVTSGTYDRTFDMSLNASFGTAFLNNNGGTPTIALARLIDGLNQQRGYLNVHTTFAAGGEIRGTLVALVPEPSTWLSMIFGFGLLGAAMRRPAVKTRVRYT